MWAIIVIALLLLIQDGLCIEMKEMTGPVWVNQGEKVTLICKYDLGRDALYSVKWFKGHQEIYRYIPTDQPEYKYFSATGIIIDESSTRPNHLVLKMTGPLGSDTFRCEVTTETPSFVTLDRRKNITVVVPPKMAPELSGLRDVYQMGDLVELNCSSLDSKPAAQISWTLNGLKATSEMLLPVLHEVNQTTGLETSVSGIRFVADRRHFEDGRLRLECLAQIEGIWETSVEEMAFATVANDSSSFTQIVLMRNSMNGGESLIRTGWPVWLPVLLQLQRGIFTL